MVKYGQMKEILTALMIWLGANTTLDTNHDIPKVVFLPQEKMEQMYYVDEPEKLPNELHGIYDTDSDTIILRDTWDRRKPWDMGVLVGWMEREGRIGGTAGIAVSGCVSTRGRWWAVHRRLGETRLEP